MGPSDLPEGFELDARASTGDERTLGDVLQVAETPQDVLQEYIDTVLQEVSEPGTPGLAQVVTSDPLEVVRGVVRDDAGRHVGHFSMWVRFGRGAVATETGFTPRARAVLINVGLDANNLPPELAQHIETTFAAKGETPAALREAQAAEFGFPLSRGQATADPQALAQEGRALAGQSGPRAQQIGEDFAARQADALAATRNQFMGMAAGDAPRVDSPQQAFEGAADRARQIAQAQRMGTAVIDGQRQRMVGGAEALIHGYSPQRRSVLWNVDSCIIKSGGPLKDLYDARKIEEIAKCEAIAADPVQRGFYARGGRYAPKLHAHNRARRYIEKRFLRELWRAWRE